MRTKYSYRAKLKYLFENTFSAGSIALFAWLTVFSIIIIVAGAALITIYHLPIKDGKPVSFIEAVWQSLMRTLDPGTVTGDEGWVFRIISLVITLGGVLIFSSVIGIITSGIREKLEELRKGKTQVYETGHTLLLGWSDLVFDILMEFNLSTKINDHKKVVVILSEKDKVSIEDEIRSRVPNRSKLKIVIRSGNPLDITDLKIVNPQEAESIIILSPEEKNPDIFVIKCLMALINKRPENVEHGHIVCEIENEKNVEIVEMVGDRDTVFVNSTDFISRLLAQSCHQSGISILYLEILSFKGSEIYFLEFEDLIGSKFDEVLFRFNHAVVIGIQREGELFINPEKDLILEKEDKIIFIAKNRTEIVLSQKKAFPISLDKIAKIEKPVKKLEKIVILGWNKKASHVIRELDRYLAKGSEIEVITDRLVAEKEMGIIESTLKNIELRLTKKDIAKKETIENIDFNNIGNIIILSYEDMDIQDADALTLVVLLFIRNILGEKSNQHKIITEILDHKNLQLLEVNRIDDFIVSEKLISLALTQLSNNKFLKEIFEDLFDSDGVVIQFIDAKNYVKLNEKVNFITVLQSAINHNQIAIGYRIIDDSHDSSKNYGIYLNPVKTEEIQFKEEDKIIVILNNF